MFAIRLPVGTVLALLCLLAIWNAPEVRGADDEPMPTLLGLITTRLTKVEGLRPSDGVKITQATFSRGVVRLTGSVATAQQRQQIEREVTALQSVLESMLDIKIREIDVSRLRIASRLTPPKETNPPEKEPTTPQGKKSEPRLKPTPKTWEDSDVINVVWYPPVVVWDAAWSAPPVWPQPVYAPYAPPMPVYYAPPLPAYAPAPYCPTCGY